MTSCLVDLLDKDCVVLETVLVVDKVDCKCSNMVEVKGLNSKLVEG